MSLLFSSGRSNSTRTSRLQRPSTELYASVTLIVLGTIVSAVAESGLPTWSTWGVVVFMCSCVFEAVRTAMSQSLLQPFGFTAFESLVFTLPLTTLLTLLGPSRCKEFTIDRK